jgi:hypothetical protein
MMYVYMHDNVYIHDNAILVMLQSQGNNEALLCICVYARISRVCARLCIFVNISDTYKCVYL